MYLIMKHVHLTFVALSIALFIFRFVLSVKQSPWLQGKLLKVLPHAIDTLLLLSALSLCVILQQYPFVQTWLTVKVVGVVLYILLGLIALKKARTMPVKWMTFLAALAVLGITAKVAIYKDALWMS